MSEQGLPEENGVERKRYCSGEKCRKKRKHTFHKEPDVWAGWGCFKQWWECNHCEKITKL